jgi:glutamyl-tRNA reductase
LVGGELEAAFAAAYAAARRVRRETRIAERPVSIAAAALGLARDIHGDLDRRALLVLGPSDMGELMADQFQRAGMTNLIVCGPEPRAKLAAEQLGANRVPLTELDGALVTADIVIAALGSGRMVLTVPVVASVLKRRRLRPLFIIDVGFPADAEPAVNDLDGAFRYDLGDLERIALKGREQRQAEADDARRIIAEELESLARRRKERRAVPAVIALREHVETLRREALSGANGDAELATRLLMNRLLHDPSEVLRGSAASSDDVEAMEYMLRRLFRLGGEKGEEK